MKSTKILLAALIAVTPVAAIAQQPVVEPGALSLHAADTYRKAARYPAHNEILKDAFDPIRDKAVSQPIVVRHQAEGEVDVPGLEIWNDKVSYQIGEPVAFFARGLDGELLSVAGEIVNRKGETVASVNLFDDGSSFDKAAGDGVWSAQASFLKSLPTPELAESYMFKLDGTFADGTTQRAVGGFLLSNPWAELTGKYRDRVIDGNLVVRAQVEVTKEGRFHLAGTLYSADGEPVGTAQTAIVLEPGKHWINLSWYGLLLQDRGLKGPFTLGSLQLRTTGGMPNAFNNLVENAHTTRVIGLKALNSAPYGQVELIKAAERLEAEAAEARAAAAMPDPITID